ncbi:MAG TPA: FtsQ-type POTRA domain-containing protein [Candidatus Polarisedimenticolia bacterium]|nr:FtsQ-type POTRA domain-containing protein [Candidatus Polarisedimenticolia bacterium]
MDLKRPNGTDQGRFLRRGRGAQVVRRRRARGLRRALLSLSALFACGVVAGTLYAARYYLTHTEHLALRRFEFTGTAHAPEGDLRRALGRYRGRNLFTLDLDRMARDLAACRWVKSAVVKRVLPDTLFCAIEERTPRGLALLRGRVWLIDAEGATIDPLDARTREYSFPILTGLDEHDAARAQAQLARGVSLLAYLDEARPGFSPEISEIDMARDDRLDLRLNDGGPIVRLNPRDFGSNLDRYLTMRGYLATHFGDGAYVDLRFRDRIAFQPTLARTD